MKHQGMDTRFTVLMSVYAKENPDYLNVALNSIFVQKLRPDQVVLVCDGPLTPSLETVICAFQKRESILEVHRLKTNQGLQHALNYGLEFCRFKLIARMDTDDISVPLRFYKQVAYFKNNANLAIVGSGVSEFTHNPDEIKSIKRMPTTRQEIKKYAKYRNPFNHPTVMFKKSVIQEVGQYRDMNLFEDYDLWLRILDTEYDWCNSEDYLVKMRTVDDIYRRRGGFSYIRKVTQFRLTNYREKRLNTFEFVISLSSQIGASIIPNKLRKYLYLNILRRKYDQIN